MIAAPAISAPQLGNEREQRRARQEHGQRREASPGWA